MFKKVTVVMLALSLSFSSMSFSAESLEDDFNTPNKLLHLCEGNYTQQEMCRAYFVGFLHAMREASVANIVEFDFQSHISGLTLERQMRKDIEAHPKSGDDLTEAIMLFELNKLGVIKFKFKS